MSDRRGATFEGLGVDETLFRVAAARPDAAATPPSFT
jgi:hypothetical protein